MARTALSRVSDSGLFVCFSALAIIVLGADMPPDEPASDAEQIRLGNELFEHLWQANDARSYAGDGLGPLYNGRSCAECHFLGGIGGAGPGTANVETLTFRGRPGLESLVRTDREENTADTKPKPAEIDALAAVHPGLLVAPSILLHHSGTDSKYATWRAGIVASAQKTVRPGLRARISQALTDDGDYYRDSAGKRPSSTKGPASAREWRTPPLWGCRDSAPYLHEGRAATLSDAIQQHGGEAAESQNRFARLSAGEKLLLGTYLTTLGVPERSTSGKSDH
jgi:hypothetical protein